MSRFQLQVTVPDELAGKRLDQALSSLCPEHSRSRIQSWIKSGDVSVNNINYKQRDEVSSGDVIAIDTKLQTIDKYEAENINLDIIYEDNDIIIINKPVGLVVHPGAGNPNHTLVNALLNFDNTLEEIPRAGIIHRLDKDTTGVMVVARTLESHTFLVKRLQERVIKREYQTVVCGQIIAGGSIENKMGRHPVHRTKMAVTSSGKVATTHYKVIKKFQHYTHLHVQLETGRTHQIRVHMSHIKHPVIGDPVYGHNKSIRKGVDSLLREIITNFKRQALHAFSLELPHPSTDQKIKFTAELPEDMIVLIEGLNKYDQAEK
ncbi:MAG: 23S rRNA pseudouridine(1911/1915/1917) synthase RluD [Proteobacteria bacterium]|nr:23S rRNA pseudouridine(1911/1915/1917) synthase RluD [Pseudomonadota bacterium]NOG60112.1 23S rRNA pseudouridine(1911/1915/1917) synthase RluD [Pseudomonadota bacterium]